MAQYSRPPLSRAEREAHRAMLEEALARLPTADDPERSASDVMRALDAYLEATGSGTALSPREPPVTDYSGRREHDELRWVKWFVIGGAAFATAVVAVTLSGVARGPGDHRDLGARALRPPLHLRAPEKSFRK